MKKSDSREKSKEVSPSFSSIWILLVLAIVAFCVHSLPLSISPFPFNNDGLTESSISRQILESRHIDFPDLDLGNATHSESTPVFNVMMAFVSSVLGIDPLFVSQVMVAAIAPLSTVGTYVLLMKFTRDRRASLIGGLFTTLYGTFLFLTASVWKESLGVSLFVLLVFAYCQRADLRMRILEVMILLSIPFVHHLAAVISYMMIGYLTVWSCLFALIESRLRRRQYEDLIVLGTTSLFAVSYYEAVAFGRLAYLDPLTGLLPLAALLVLLSVASAAILLLEKHARGTFAPIPAIVVVVALLWGFDDSLFQYHALFPSFYAALVVSSAVIFSFAWYGFEQVIESRSRYRAIPLFMFLPAITVILFAFVSPAVESKDQLIYRSFDFADPALGIGAGLAFWSLLRFRRLYRPLLALFLVCLIVTLPFGIYTNQLLGIRHDTHGFEVDALEWTKNTWVDSNAQVQTDERLSYIGMSLFGIGKDNRLPRNLLLNASLAPDVYYVYEESWASKGVSVYPNGNIKLSEHYMERLLQVEDVAYVGGDVDDQVVIFSATAIGQTYNNWYPWVP